MVGANDISLVSVKAPPVINDVKDSGRIENEMRPHFFQPENLGKPFFTTEQNQENWIEKKKSDNGIEEKKGAPKPLKWKSDVSNHV